MVKDRRTFQRLYGIVNVRYAVKGRDQARIETLPRNIGGGGIAICLTEELQRGTLLELEITIPDNPQRAILGSGEVLWTKPFGTIARDRRVSLYETGVKFTENNHIALRRVYSYFHQSESN